MDSFYLNIEEKQTKSKPGIKGYFIGAGVFLLGMISHIIIWVWPFIAMFTGMQCFKMPGSHQIHLEPGQYTLYHEYDSYDEEKDYSTGDINISQYTWSLRRQDTPNTIDLNPYSNATYHFDWFGKYRNGRSVFTFVIPQEGDYLLTANSPRDLPTEFIVSIKLSSFPAFMKAVVFTLLISVPLYLIGVIIFWRTFFKRLKAKKLAANM